MTKSIGKKGKSRTLGRRKIPHLSAKAPETPVKYVGYLLKLHKLQGVLLNQLNKVVR